MFETFINVYTKGLPIVLAALAIVFTIALPVALLNGLSNKEK